MKKKWMDNFNFKKTEYLKPPRIGREGLLGSRGSGNSKSIGRTVTRDESQGCRRRRNYYSA